MQIDVDWMLSACKMVTKWKITSECWLKEQYYAQIEIQILAIDFCFIHAFVIQ